MEVEARASVEAPKSNLVLKAEEPSGGASKHFSVVCASSILQPSKDSTAGKCIVQERHFFSISTLHKVSFEH